MPEGIDNNTLHRAPTLPTPPQTITCNYCSVPSLTPDMPAYHYSSASDLSHTENEYNLCRSRDKAACNHHSCPYQDDDDWQQFVAYPDDIEFQQAAPTTDTQAEPVSPPITRIDSAIFEGYKLLTVAHIGVYASRADIKKMYDHNKQS